MRRLKLPARGNLLAGACASLVFSASPALAATFTPADVAGLVAAINTANTNGQSDTIDLGGQVFTLTVVDNSLDGPNGLPAVLPDGGSTLTIRNGTIERTAAAPALRLLRVAAGASLALESLALQGGLLDTTSTVIRGAAILNAGTLQVTGARFSANRAYPGQGGAIENQGVLDVAESFFQDNSASFGGAVLNNALLSITGSSFWQNFAEFEGGAIVNAGTVSAIRNSTFSENVTLYGGAIYNQGSIGAISNSTFALNEADYLGSHGGAIDNSPEAEILELAGNILARSSGGGHPDLTNSGVIVSASDNVIGIGELSGIPDGVNGNQVGSLASPLDPLLGPLADNGGPTLTHALLAGSPAIDRGSNPAGLAWDQRGAGFARVSGVRADAGAFELQMAALALTIVDHPDPVAAGRTVTWRVTLGNSGTAAAEGVHLATPLPAGTAFVSLTAPATWGCATPTIGTNGTVACSAASFPPGTALFTIVAVVAPETPPETTLSITAVATSTSPDPDASATETTTVLEPGAWADPSVPVLGNTGLALLGLLVALGGALVVGRRVA